MFQMKKQYKNPEELGERAIDNLLEKNFRVMPIKIIKKLKRRIDAQRETLETFNKELENIKG